MSCWTRAKVKFWINGKVNINDIQRLVGFSCDYKSISILKPFGNKEVFLPLGSEGTLQIYVNKSTKTKTVFTVEGNLRDVWDVEPIQKWFNKVCNKIIESYWGNCVFITKAKGTASTDGMKSEFKLYYKYPNKRWD